jgi:ABC-type nitrate/sulfonate/bicarbonate transport system permease component
MNTTGQTGTSSSPDWLGFILDLTPLYIYGAAYATTTQMLPFSVGTVDPKIIQDHLAYSLPIAAGGAAIGMVIALVLAFLLSAALEYESDQRFLFFTIVPLLPLLGLLMMLWFGIGNPAGGMILAVIFSAAAAIPILMPLARESDKRPSILIDAVFTSFVCALACEILRESLGSAKGIGYFAMQSIATFDVPKFFLVLLVLCIMTSALAVARRGAQFMLTQRMK